MTPQEQQLIQGVAQRLRNANLTEKDAEADALINKEIGAQPDSTYVLTQAVILQEYALKQAESKIQGLQKRLEETRQQGSNAEQAPGASFLGGLFGGGDRQRAGASPSRTPAGAGRRDPWGGPAGQAAAAQPQAAGGGFGSFMRSAAAMAVGVAGGTLLAGAIQDMFADEQGGAEQASAEDGGTAVEEPLAEAEAVEEPYQDPEMADDYEAESEFDFGGDDFGDDDWA